MHGRTCCNDATLRSDPVRGVPDSQRGHEIYDWKHLVADSRSVERGSPDVGSR